MAAGAEFLHVERRAGQPYAIIWLRREPVNAMSRGLWQALAAAVESLEADPQVGLNGCTPSCSYSRGSSTWKAPDERTSRLVLGGTRGANAASLPCPAPSRRHWQVRGFIIASGLRRDIFMAGQDLREIYAPLTTQEQTRCAAWGWCCWWLRWRASGHAAGRQTQQATQGSGRDGGHNVAQVRLLLVPPSAAAQACLLCRAFSRLPTATPGRRQVWLAMNGCLRRIFASPLASVAAIKGKRCISFLTWAFICNTGQPGAPCTSCRAGHVRLAVRARACCPPSCAAPRRHLPCRRLPAVPGLRPPHHG